MAGAVVLGGSRGIGRAIADALESAGIGVLAASSRDVDTSDLESVRRFARAHTPTDILVLNTGGPPPKTFAEVEEADWQKYHNQLFAGFCTLLREMAVNPGGYIFLISSTVIIEPDPRLVISAAYRAAFAEVFKVLSRDYARDDISCISIAPGPTDTERMRELVGDVDAFAGSLPMGRLGRPSEIGEFVRGIVTGRIKYLSGITIPFDGARSARAF